MQNDARALRRTGRLVAAGCMLAAPVLLVGGTAYHQPVVGDQTEQFLIAAGDPTRWGVSHALIVTANLLLFPVAFALAYMLRDRRPRLAMLGLALTVTGMSTNIGYIALHGFAEWHAAGGDPVEGAALMERIFSSPGVMLFFVALPVLGIPGYAVLLLGLHGEGLMPAWMSLGILAGPAISGLGATALMGSTVLFVGGSIVMLLALPPLGLRLLRWSDDQFANPPAWAPSRLPGLAQSHRA